MTLEFEDDGITYLVKREFAEPGKVRFGKSMDSMDEYSVVDLRVIFGNIFFGKDDYKGVFENNWFRSLIKFFIKDDINHYERKDPLKFISTHKSNFETYVYNLFLLGLPNKSVYDYSVIKEEIDALTKMRTRANKRIKEETGKKIGELSSEINLLDKKIGSFQESLDKFEFLSSYEDVEKELINISSQISLLLNQLTPIEKRLNVYRKSYEYEIEIDTKKIANIYSEVKVIFGDAVKKQLDDVVSFRKKLAENRKKFLANKEIELSAKIEDLKKRISAFEKKRSALYKILDEKKALDSIKNTYQLMIEEKAKREKIVSSIESVRKIEEDLFIQNKLRGDAVSDIASELNAVQKQIESIRSIFLDIVSESIHIGSAEDAVFDIRPAPDMKSPVMIDIEIPKSEALGKQRLKVLTYDLTVFFNLIEQQRALPNFLVQRLGWKKVVTRKINKDMFIAKVVGKSMEPAIPDGSWCLFRFERGGSRNGLVVLAESRLVADPETNHSFTIKRYRSEKIDLGSGQWRHKKIILSPDNKAFKDIVLENVTGDDFRVMAEFVEVLKYNEN